ncbi:MAG: asparaginyl/glutamyl-tRNA amidotransferase subunit C [Verrucomicrobia bacterium GWC2_42_7]|nr:MAG: asparaginyl/glutamyl-tRNA amidotransferase subunit C [Verrucomicrobia bacterium GWC2_42_7]
MDTSKHKIDIDYVAQLARIELSDAEKVKFSGQLENIITYCEKISQVNVDGIEPMSHSFPFYNVWEEDTPESTFAVEDVLLNAPKADEDQIVVPRVVEE